MRFTLLFCLLATMQASAFGYAPFPLHNAVSDLPGGNYSPGFSTSSSGAESTPDRFVLTLAVDSIHHVNCLRATGYLSVLAEGGVAPYTYAWSNGLTVAVGTSLAPGAYDITVTDDLGATATVSATILEDLAPPSADAGADFIAPCANSIVSLSGTGSVGPEFAYLWTASAGGVIQSGATTLTPVISHTGAFTLKVTNTNNGCTATDAVIVGAGFQPPIAIVTGGTIKCSEPLITLSATFTPNNIVYHWTGPGGFSSDLTDPQVGIPGVYTFTLTDTVTTCIGTANTTVAIDTISPTAATSGGGIVTCSDPTVTLNGSGTPAGVAFEWSGPNGFTSALPNVVVDEPGDYILTVTKPTNGCVATSTINVGADNTPPTASAGVTGIITCAVNAVQLIGDGSPAGVSFQWSGPLGFTSSSQSPSAFAPGDYLLTVKNPGNGCTTTASVTVEANTVPPGATATGGVKTCADPIVTLEANSPTPGVSYFWTGPNGFSSNLQSPDVSLFGSYKVTVTDPVNGCVSTATANVTQNLTPPPIQSTTTTVTCTNPSPQITASSQTPGATFSWTGPGGFTSNVNNPNVTEGGTYTVTATNPANGCTSFINVYVNENTTPPYVYAGDDRALNCLFTTILANPLGTSMGNNFTYQWTTWDGHIFSGANTLYARFDTAGHYTLTVRNTQNGCTAVDSMEVTQADPVTVVANQLNAVSCNGGNNGSAKATGGGGNFVFSYSWSNGAQTATATNLAAGTYTVTATDNEGCSATATVTLTQPPAMLANVSTTPQTMVDLNNGTATVTPVGGSSPYTVLWSNGGTTLTISGLAPGAYTVTVTDSKGCTQVNSATVNTVLCALSGDVAATAVNCFGATNGSATANISGGVGTVIYQWSNGASTQTATDLAAGDYTVTASDANGCSITLLTKVTGPQQLTLSVANQTNVLCPDGQTGAATMGVSGGTTPYTYAWSNGGADAGISGLVVGTYSCTVTDTNGCSEIQSVQIIAADVNPPQLLLQNASVVLGTDGQVTLTAAMFDNGSTDECTIANWTISPATFNCGQLGPQTVTLTATDQNGNTATATATATVTDNSAPVLTCPQDIQASECNAAVTYTLPLVSDNCAANTTPTLVSGLPSGSVFPVGTVQQEFSVTDQSGNTGVCSFTVTVSDSIKVVPTSVPASCSATCNGSVSLVITGGNAPVLVSWSNGETGVTIDSLCSGNYDATLTDASGCTVVQSATLIVEDTEAPALTCPADMAAGACNPVVTFTLPQILDNCPIVLPNISLVAGLASGSTFPVGVTTQTYQYTDAGDNEAQCSFTITVNPALGLTVDQVTNDPGNTGSGSISITVTGGGAPYTYAWTFNGQAFASTEDLSNLLPGQYAVTVTDANGCTVVNTAITVSNTVAATEPENDLSWSLYPNPASTEVYLKVNDAIQGDLRLDIFDATGRWLQQQEIQVSGTEPARIALDGLPDGLLMFRLTGEKAFRVKSMVKAR